jgi:4a-hydroxytetrahydrobiopterin dehydratase
MNLEDRKCTACEGSVVPLKEPKLSKYLSQLDSSWILNDEAKLISKDYNFQNFKDAMEFVNSVADLAEQEGHHPDVFISYNKVTLTLTTHAINGLSENDFIMAAKINSI